MGPNRRPEFAQRAHRAAMGLVLGRLADGVVLLGPATILASELDLDEVSLAAAVTELVRADFIVAGRRNGLIWMRRLPMEH